MTRQSRAPDASSDDERSQATPPHNAASPSRGKRGALRGFQRRHLRKLAHALRPVVHVGEAGGAPPVIAALDRALLDHELVKVRLHDPNDKKALAKQLAVDSGAELCGLVGHTVILYRRNEDEPRIDLPLRAGSPR